MKSCITLFVFVNEISPVVNSLFLLLVFKKSLFSSPSLWIYCCLTVKGSGIYFQGISVSPSSTMGNKGIFLGVWIFGSQLLGAKRWQGSSCGTSPLCTGSGASVRTVLLSHLLSAAQCRFRRTILQNIVGAHRIPFPGKNFPERKGEGCWNEPSSAQPM